MSNSERICEWNGGVYVIRDVWADEKAKKLDHCEYAIKDAEGNVVWKPCQEGVLFADIEPFDRIAA